MSIMEIETLLPRSKSSHELRIEELEKELEKLTGACGTIIKNEDTLLSTIRAQGDYTIFLQEQIDRQIRRIDKLEIDVEQLEDAAMKG
jgi:hypothetical protein